MTSPATAKQSDRLCLRACVTTLLLAVAAVAVLPGAELRAQGDNQFETWTDWTSIYGLSQTWQYDGDYGLRGFIAPDYWNSMYLRPSVRYKPRRWLSLHGGLGGFYLWSEVTSDAVELRPWLGALARWPQFGLWAFSHYVRLEQQLVWVVAAGVFDGSWRLRYRLQLNTPSWRIGQGAKTIYGSVSFELFGDPAEGLGELYRNRSRLTLALGHRLDPRWRVEVHYIRQGTGGTIVDGFERTDNILRLRVKTELD